MGEFKRITGTIREYITDRRRTPRRGARYASRLQFQVSVMGDGEASARPNAASLSGRTRDLGEGDLTLIVPSIRIGGDYLTLKDSRLAITLELPSGAVKLIGTPARFEQLDGNTAGEGYLVGVRITEMAAPDRERYVEHLRTLPNTDRRTDTYRLREA